MLTTRLRAGTTSDFKIFQDISMTSEDFTDFKRLQENSSDFK